MFDIIKLVHNHCEGVGMYISRYDTREVKLNHRVDSIQYLTSAPYVFHDHEI